MADAVVEETNLAGNIYALRQTLGEGKGEHTYIETIPKRGYRFIAKVRELPDKSPDTMMQGLEGSINRSAGSKGSVGSSPIAVGRLAKQLSRSKVLLVGVILAGLAVAAFLLLDFRPVSAARTKRDRQINRSAAA